MLYESEQRRNGTRAMDQIAERKYIDWTKTGKSLLLLRNDNLNLRRYVCRANRYHMMECTGACETCRFDMDNSISRAELASVFHVSENVIFNWENGRTPVSLEDMLFYCQIARVELSELIVFE